MISSLEKQIAGFNFARQNLLSFCIGRWAGYKVSKHHRIIAKKLEAVERGEIKRLMIFMPPRHGKSELASINFPAWYLGRNPDKFVISVSYSQELATDFGRKVRNVMADDLYRYVFPKVRLAEDSQSSKRFHTSQGGVYYCMGVGGGLTGRGAHLAILDDVIKNREDANSPVLKKKIQDWYTSTLYTRLMPESAVVIINTRWSEDDLSGWLLSQPDGDKWDVVSLPAINEANEALWPEAYSIEKLLEIKRAIGTKDFESLYQQRPSPEEGNILKRQWFKFYDTMPKASFFDQIIQSWDMTFTGKATSDFVVGQVWGKKGSEKYLLDQMRGRFGMNETLQAFTSLSQKWPQSSLKLIENKANGPAVEDMLKKKISGIVLWEPQGDKVSRANAVAPQFEAGNIYLPSNRLCPWINDVVEEFATFPNAAHDDTVDAMTMSLLRLEDSGNVGTIRVIMR